MTQPVQEPSGSRTDARLGFGNAQLFRRPAQPSEDPAEPVYNMPWCAALGGSGTVQLPQATFNAGPNDWIEVPFNFTDAANVNYRGYDYANAADKVFDTSKSQLPGFYPLGIRKKGLYLISIEIHQWTYAWGKLSRVYIETSTIFPNNLFFMYGWGSTPGTLDNGGAHVQGDEAESGDVAVSVRAFGLFRKVSDATTDWAQAKGRHITAATRSFTNVYFTAIRLAPNPYDTNVFTGGTIPG